MAALQVKWPSGPRITQDQAARSIFILRIILDHFAGRDRCAYLINPDVAQDGLVGGMAREFERLAGKLFADLVHQLHWRIIPRHKRGSQ
jgi:hypothetical protein